MKKAKLVAATDGGSEEGHMRKLAKDRVSFAGTLVGMGSAPLYGTRLPRVVARRSYTETI